VIVLYLYIKKLEFLLSVESRRSFELPYELVHIVAGVIYVFFGGFGGFHALKSFIIYFIRALKC
jgi:hypothetical protein